MDSEKQNQKELSNFVSEFIVNEPKKYPLKQKDSEFSCLLLLTGPDSGSIELVTHDLKYKYITSDDFSLGYLKETDVKFGSYERLEEVMEDLASACALKQIKMEFAENILKLKMKIQFNQRTKYLIFSLQQTDMKVTDKNHFLVEENIDLRKKLHTSQERWEYVQNQLKEIESILEVQKNEEDDSDDEIEEIDPIIEKYQHLKCYQCGREENGNMTICENESDPKRSDEYGQDGYTACCSKEECQSKITKVKYFARKVGDNKGKEKKSGSSNVLIKYQNLQCYQCGAKNPQEMTICKNAQDPDRNDNYGKDGYTACCPKQTCQEKITKKEYYKEKIGSPMDIANKYQWFKCYQCGDQINGQMTICENSADVNRDDAYGKDGFTGCCPKQTCQKYIGEKEYFKFKIGTPKEQTIDLSGLSGDDLIIMKYQSLKCYQCGEFNKGKMTICKNDADPGRNDEYGKDGYTGCCPKENCLAKIGDKKFFGSKVGHPDDIGSTLINAMQNLKCYKCGKVEKGKMTVCINKKSPDRDDEYGKDGYSVCCPRQDCLKFIGTQPYFEIKIGNPQEARDYIKKFQVLACYVCKQKVEDQMTIFKNLQDPERDDDQCKDGFIACCTEDTCIENIEANEAFKIKIGRQGKLLKGVDLTISQYQDLKCYKCGFSKIDEMIICFNEEDPDRNNDKGRDGYSACCPKWKCTDLIGEEKCFQKRLGKRPNLIEKYQYLTCYQCGAQEKGKMIICKNQDNSRNDKYGIYGYTATCTKESCQKQIGVKNYYLEKVEHDFRLKYQVLQCYSCGTNVEGQMIVCMNGKDPEREDKYGQDGYSACCPKEECQAKIGVEDYFKEIATKKKNRELPVNAIEKYQILSCYKCGDCNKGKMTICINGKDPDTQDQWRRDGFTACCAKEDCQKLIGVESYFKDKVKDIIPKYQYLKCYDCGDSEEGKMTICFNKEDPERDDEKGKDGFTACCSKEECQNKIELNAFWKVLIGGGKNKYEKYQTLKCYQCGSNEEGKMTVCKNGQDPNRSDEYGKNGYVVCCPKTSCQAQIGQKKYFDSVVYNPNKIETEVEEEETVDGKISVFKKHQYLKCYQCGKNTSGKMSICMNEKDPNRDDEYGKEGYTACCQQKSCQKVITKEDYFKVSLMDIIKKHQVLKCYECGANTNGSMSICKNGKDPDRDDDYGKDGYSALCQKENCQSYLGTRDANKIYLGIPKDLDI